MWSVRVTAFDSQPATAFVRRHRFSIGDPLHFDAEYDRVTALEYVLAAIGADVVGGLRLLTRRQRIELDRLEAVVQAELENPLIHLGVIGEAGTPAIERVRVRVFASPAEAERAVRPLWEETLRRSPLVQTFRRALQLDLDLSFTY